MSIVTTTIVAGKDTYLSFASKDNNYGGAATLIISSQARGLLYFDLSGIPADATVLSATLQLYSAISGTTKAHTVWRILAGNANWPQGTAIAGVQVGSCSWNHHTHNTVHWAGAIGLGTAGVDYDATPLGAIAFPNSAANALATLALAPALVQTWIGPGATNYGLRLTGPDLSPRSWHATRAVNPAYWPSLFLEYELPEPPGPTPPQPDSARGLIVEYSLDGTTWTDISGDTSGIRAQGGERKIGSWSDFRNDAPAVVVGKRGPMVVTVSLAYDDRDTQVCQAFLDYQRNKTPLYLRWCPYGASGSKWLTTSPACALLSVEHPTARALAGDPLMVSARVRCSEILVSEKTT